MSDYATTALWYTHLVTLLGAMVLALPVLRVDQLGRRLSRLARLAPLTADDPRWAPLTAKLQTALQGRRANWSPLNRVCLWLGYAMVLGSQAARLVITA